MTIQEKYRIPQFRVDALREQMENIEDISIYVPEKEGTEYIISQFVFQNAREEAFIRYIIKASYEEQRKIEKENELSLKN